MESFFGGDEMFRRQAAEIIKKVAKKNNFIPFKQGRPKRDKLINNDDLTNLTIILNTSKSIEELISKM